MRTITILLFMFSLFHASSMKEDKITSNYSCSTTVAKGRRCTGSAYCTACTNCSRCAHCSNGGSCGVCSGGSTETNYTPSKKSRRYSKPNYATRTYNKNETVYVAVDTINVRKGPSYKYDIIEKIYFGDSISYLEKSGLWIKIKVEKTGTVGYVSAKLLNQ